MTDKTVKTPLQAGSTPTHTLPAGRRRFIKGTALALPAVLTLRSGGLAAMSVPCSQRSENAFEVENNPEGSCALSTMP